MSQYQLIFSGELVEGKTRAQIEPLVIKAMKLSDKMVNVLFQADEKPVVLKKVNTLEDANVLCGKFRKIGLVLEIKHVGNKSDVKVAASKPPSLSLQPIEKKAVKPSEVNNVQTAQLEDDVVESLSTVIFSVVKSAISPALILFILGLYMVLNYSPYPDGFLRNGFAVGAIILTLGALKLKRRFD